MNERTRAAPVAPQRSAERSAAVTPEQKPLGPSLSLAPPLIIQRKLAGGDASPPELRGAGGLLVDDDLSPGPGAMRKTEFLNKLRSEICAAVDRALVRAGQSTRGCPYVERWLAHYEDQSAAHVERALQKYAPAARNATSADEYIDVIVQRAELAAERWAETGDLSGLPEGLVAEMSVGMGVLGALSGGIGGLFDAGVSALFKREQGAPAAARAPARGRLGAGRALDTGVRGRMEHTFGCDFSSVRVHADSSAASMSSELHARAFTVGTDIAFAAGEYQPGTPTGDALLAHELAHVVQQQNASSLELADGSGESSALEDDADRAAVAAAVALHAGALKPERPWPRLRTQLRLQRCNSGDVKLDQKVGAGGRVEVRTGLDAPRKDNLIRTSYLGPDAFSHGFVQFIWSEAIVATPQGPVWQSGNVRLASRDDRNENIIVPLTSDPAHPIWMVDPPLGGPFYTPSSSAAEAQAIEDRPSTPKELAKAFFDRHAGSTELKIVDHFETYLFKNGKPVHVVRWSYTSRFTRSPKGEVSDEERTYGAITGEDVSVLPEHLRVAGEATYPNAPIFAPATPPPPPPKAAP